MSPTFTSSREMVRWLLDETPWPKRLLIRVLMIPHRLRYWLWRLCR